MTRQAIRGVGYCARKTRAGDWAFRYALDLAVKQGVALNIFFFPTPPCLHHMSRGRRGELGRLPPQRAVELEREIRLYYDPLLGEYENVGFRLCEGDEDPELRHCLLIKKDYDVLVLAYEGYRCKFGNRSIEEFAQSMACPAILVGPEHRDQFFVNSSAELWLDSLSLVGRDWARVCDVAVRRGSGRSA
jgi:hypothetical protein